MSYNLVMDNAANKYSVGDKVTCNGYPGTVIAVTDYGMIEVRLPSGSVCVDPNDELTVRPRVAETLTAVIDDEHGYCSLYSGDGRARRACAEETREMNMWTDITETMDIEFITRCYKAQQLTLAGGWNMVSRAIVYAHMNSLSAE